MLVEAVCCSVRDACLAEAAGAGRIELCSALESGGLTPSIGMMRRVRKTVALPIMAMVRPRAGDFAFEEEEWAVALDDARALLDEGADGLVFGALTTTLGGCGVDPRSAEIADLAPGRCTYHRAIDAAADPIGAARQAAEMGYARVLTSGGHRSALEGATIIRSMAEHLPVLVCGKVRSTNVGEIVDKSGAREVHLGPRRAMGGHFCSHIAEFGIHSELDVDEIRQIVTLLAGR